MNEECKCDGSLKTEKRQAKFLLGIGLVTVVSVALSIWLAPYFFVEDTSAVTRYMILKIPPMMVDIFVLIGGLVLLDFINHEDSLSNINKDPMATSILYSALLIALGISIAFG